eukprot:4663000-Heterocapsa_arctica.AAC.1
MRGSFGTIYKFLQDLRTANVPRTALPVDVWWQMMEASLLLPLAQLDLGASWSSRLVTSDASTVAQGLAYTYVDPPR